MNRNISRKDMENTALFRAQGSILAGQIRFGKNCSVWYNAVIRADKAAIEIGDNVNIQDNCVVHVDEGYAVCIGNNVTVGHSAIVHGCSIGENSLVGMGAIIMNDAVIGKNCIVAAGALVPQGAIIPDGSLVVGSPGKVRRSLTKEETESNLHNAVHYVEMSREYMAGKYPVWE